MDGSESHRLDTASKEMQSSYHLREMTKNLRKLIWEHVDKLGWSIESCLDGTAIPGCECFMDFKKSEFVIIEHIANMIAMQRISRQNVDRFFNKPDPLQNIENQVKRLTLIWNSKQYIANNYDTIIVGGIEVNVSDWVRDEVHSHGLCQNDRVQCYATNSDKRKQLDEARQEFVDKIISFCRQIQSLHYSRHHPFTLALWQKCPFLKHNETIYPTSSMGDIVKLYLSGMKAVCDIISEPDEDNEDEGGIPKVTMTVD
jgi:hypothetical protein